MHLSPDKSLCQATQKTIVSRDKGNARMHRAINPGQQFHVRHYQLDGDIVKQQKCCDYLLINDSSKTAYFIELKGGNIDDAVPQLQKGADFCRPELPGYSFYYRIVASKVRTHDVQKNTFRKFKDSCGSRLVYKCDFLEESLF